MQSFHDSTRSASNSSLVLASGMFSSGWCCSAGILISFNILLMYFTSVTQIMLTNYMYIDVCAFPFCAASSIIYIPYMYR